MAFTESDIDFFIIRWNQFEELCYDILLKAGFHSLIWRQGGGDQGRDIEARLSRSNLLVNGQDEKWYIECKHHSRALNVDDISNKIAWAESASIDFFLLMTSGHITNDTRAWLDGRRQKLDFKVEVIEGKDLKQKLLAYPDVIEKYFLNTQQARVLGIKKQWLYFNILPNVESFYAIYRELDFVKLTVEDLGFLLFIYNELHEQLDEFCESEDFEKVSIKGILLLLLQFKNYDYPVLKEGEFDHIDAFKNAQVHCILSASYPDGDCMILVHDKIDSQFLDVLVRRTGKEIEIRISVR